MDKASPLNSEPLFVHSDLQVLAAVLNDIPLAVGSAA